MVGSLVIGLAMQETVHSALQHIADQRDDHTAEHDQAHQGTQGDKWRGHPICHIARVHQQEQDIIPEAMTLGVAAGNGGKPFSEITDADQHKIHENHDAQQPQHLLGKAT